MLGRPEKVVIDLEKVSRLRLLQKALMVMNFLAMLIAYSSSDSRASHPSTGTTPILFHRRPVETTAEQ